MPLYEYRCQECGEKFEKLVSFSQSEQVECANCGSEHTQKLVSGFAMAGGSSSGSSGGSSCGGGNGYFR